MPLDVPAGQVVFLDSTILHYAFVSFSDATPLCLAFLKRIEARELTGCLTVPVLNDAVHKIMCSEAKERFGLPRARLVNWMNTNPGQVRELRHADDVLLLVETLQLTLLPVNLAALFEAQKGTRASGR